MKLGIETRALALPASYYNTLSVWDTKLESTSPMWPYLDFLLSTDSLPLPSTLVSVGWS